MIATASLPRVRTLRSLLVPLGLLAGLVGAWHLVATGAAPASALSVTLLVFTSVLVLTLLTAPSDERAWLLSLVTISFGLHVLVLALVYTWLLDQLPQPFVFPDEATFDDYSVYFLRTFQAGEIPEFGARNPGYYAVTTLSYWAWGHELIWPRLINVAIGSYLLVPVYGLASLVFDRFVARKSAVLVAVVPTLLVLSTFGIRDLYIALLVVSASWRWAALARGERPGKITLQLFLIIGLLFAFRLETATIMLLAPAAWLLLFPSDRFRGRRQLAPIAVVMFVGLSAIPLGLGGFAGLGNLGPGAIRERVTLATSVVDERADSSSIIRTVMLDGSLEKRILLAPAFLLQPLVQPLPTLTTELSKLMAPGMVLTYLAFPFMAFGLWEAVRQRARHSFPVWGPVAILLLAQYVSLFLAIRFRIQYEPLLWILAVVGYSQRERMPPVLMPGYFLGAGVLIGGFVLIKANGIS